MKDWGVEVNWKEGIRIWIKLVAVCNAQSQNVSTGIFLGTGKNLFKIVYSTNPPQSCRCNVRISDNLES